MCNTQIRKWPVIPITVKTEDIEEIKFSKLGESRAYFQNNYEYIMKKEEGEVCKPGEEHMPLLHEGENMNSVSEQKSVDFNYLGVVRIKGDVKNSDGKTTKQYLTKIFMISMKTLSIVSKEEYNEFTIPDFSNPTTVTSWTYGSPIINNTEEAFQGMNTVMGATAPGDSKLFSAEALEGTELDAKRNRDLLETEESEKKEFNTEVKGEKDPYKIQDTSGLVLVSVPLTSIGVNVLGFFEIERGLYAKIFLKNYIDEKNKVEKSGVFMVFYYIVGGVLAQKSASERLNVPDDYLKNVNLGALTLDDLNTWVTVGQLKVPDDVKHIALKERMIWRNKLVSEGKLKQ